VDAIPLVRDDALGLYNSPYNSTKKTVFLIHGWTNDANHPWIISSVREILINVGSNILNKSHLTFNFLTFYRYYTGELK
jgi:hypothetical protein